MTRQIYQCPDCHKYLDEADTEQQFLLCGTCYQVWEKHTLETVRA